MQFGIACNLTVTVTLQALHLHNVGTHRHNRQAFRQPNQRREEELHAVTHCHQFKRFLRIFLAGNCTFTHWIEPAGHTLQQLCNTNHFDRVSMRPSSESIEDHYMGAYKTSLEGVLTLLNSRS